jgi:hypothetical protein
MSRLAINFAVFIEKAALLWIKSRRFLSGPPLATRAGISVGGERAHAT